MKLYDIIYNAIRAIYTWLPSSLSANHHRSFYRILKRIGETTIRRIIIVRGGEILHIVD